MNRPPGCSTTSKCGLMSLRLYSLPLAPLNNGSEPRSPRCRNETWLESMPPSMACSQLDSCSRLETKVCSGRTMANSHSGRGGRFVGGAHIGPQHLAALHQRVRGELDLLAEAAFGRLRGHLHALAVHVVFPAVIGAAQPALLVAAEPQRDAAMGAEFVDQAVFAVGIAERQESLGHDLAPDRRAIVLRQFLGKEHRHPVGAEKLAHRRAGAGLGQ